MRGRAGRACRDPGCTSRDLSKCDSPPLIYTQRKVLREYKARAEPARLKGVFHGTIRNDDFWPNTELQCWNNVVTIRNNVATKLQCCVTLASLSHTNRPSLLATLDRGSECPQKRELTVTCPHTIDTTKFTLYMD